MAIGRRLAILRLAKGFTYIRHFADEIKVPEARYIKWEKGKAMIPAETIRDLKRRYKITADWLYYGDEDGLTNQLTAEIRKVTELEGAGLAPSVPVVKFAGRQRG